MKKAIRLILVCCMIITMFRLPVFAATYDLINPITGTVQGYGYDENAGHYGIDLYATNYGDPVYAVASGTIMYSCMRNHTSEYRPGDDLCSVKIILDEPITYNGMTYVCAFYTHMSGLVYDVYCGYKPACIEEYNAGLRDGALPTESVHVEAGDLIGYVGNGNAATHLHFSFEASEADGYAMMPNSEYYNVFGWSYGESINAGYSTNIPNYSSGPSTGLTLAELQAKFPDGKYWNSMGLSYNNQDGWTNTPCNSHHSVGTYNCNAFVHNGTTIGYQCFGFALKLGYDAYGSNPKDWGRAFSLNNIKPGDIINYDGDDPGHTVFVTAVDGERIYFAECNWDDRCSIDWDRSLNKNQFNNLFNVYVAPYALQGGSSGNTGHTHNWSIVEYEALHPHKGYYRCSTCNAIGAYTGGTSYVASCQQCNDTCNCSANYAGSYVCTSNTGLIIRSGHGSEFEYLGLIPTGAYVTVTSGNGSWAHVTYNGISGYVSMTYLEMPLSPVGTYPVPFKCYPLSDAQHAADAFAAPGGAHLGYIYGTDYCTVKAIYNNGYCLVNVPWEGSTKDVYAYTGAFLNANCDLTTRTIESTATTYIRNGGSGQLGWIDPGDTVVVVDNTQASRTQVIYPHTDGTYRCGWIDNSALVHTHTYGAAATCTTAQYCTTCDAQLSPALGHVPGTAATCTTSQTCERCGSIIAPPIGHRYTAGEYIDPVHPHKIYNTCVCGARYDSGSTTTLTDCTVCNPAPTITSIECTPNPIITNEEAIITISAQGAVKYAFGIGNGVEVIYESGKITDNSIVYTFDEPGTYYVWGYAYNSAGAGTDIGGIEVNVNEAVTSVTDVSLNITNASIDIGDTLTLIATVTPSDATNKTIVWTSSNPYVASVADGIVTAISAGHTTITASTENGAKTATCAITVQGGMNDFSVTVSSSSATVTAPDGGWQEGTNIFSVVCDTACYAAVSYDGGQTYIRIAAAEVDDGYNFTANYMDADTLISVGLVGDVNGDGKISNADRAKLSAIYSGKTTASNALMSLLCDVNNDGKTTNSDMARLQAAYAGKRALDW